MAELQKHIRANSGSGLAEAQEMLMRQSLNESNGPQPNDPFLTSTHQQQQQQQQQADLHNRQESADSGLGMGSNFNLGSIPEDISGMESMDTGDLDTTLTGDSTHTAATMNSDHMRNSLHKIIQCAAAKLSQVKILNKQYISFKTGLLRIISEPVSRK